MCINFGAFSRQILNNAVQSGDVCLTVLEAKNKQLVNDHADVQCEAILKPPEDQVNIYIFFELFKRLNPI